MMSIGRMTQALDGIEDSRPTMLRRAAGQASVGWDGARGTVRRGGHLTALFPSSVGGGSAWCGSHVDLASCCEIQDIH